MYHLARFGLVASLVLLAGCPTSSGSRAVLGGDSPDVCSTPGSADDFAEAVVELVNKERTDRGLAPLTVNPTLAGIAEGYACEMIEEGFFAHEDPMTGEGPGARAMNAGYVFLSVGENLAGGQPTVEEVFDDWMNSPGHRENILSVQWEEIGVAVRTGGEFGVYWVQEFGNPP